jgi:hypothetical protein
MYCATVYARSGVNQMWILKNSKELLKNLKSPIFSQIYSIKTYDFTTLYTSIPHDRLKTRLFNMINSCFFNKNGKRKYSYLVVNHSYRYFVIHDSDSRHKYSEVDIKEMLGFLIDNIFVVFVNTIFQETIEITMGTNCVPLLFLYSYEAEFIQELLHEKNKPLALAFNSTFRYIDDVLSINNDQFHSYVDFIYPSKLEIKDTTESSTSASYLDLLLNIDADGKLTTQLYDKRGDFSFTIVNFPYICSNIPLSPAYGVYISQMIQYARACSTYDQFFSRSRLLTDKLMLQRFLQSRLMSAFRKFYGRYNDLIYNHKLSFSHMLSEIFHTNI